MLRVWWNTQEIVHQEVLESGKTVNSNILLAARATKSIAIDKNRQ